MQIFSRRINIVLFLIALINIQLLSGLEIAKFKNLKKDSFEGFHELCYYDLKVDLIIRNYVIKIKEIVNVIFKENNVTKTDEIDYALFTKVFKGGNYGKIATELANSDDYVHSYWDYFVNGNDTVMNESDFTLFMGLYYLEGELLLTEQHPTLTDFFPNEHNIGNRLGCNVAIAYWELVEERFGDIFVQFKWSLSSKFVSKDQLFLIYMSTHSGKCIISKGTKCDYFNTLFGYGMGFFNLSSGKRPSLTITEAKFAYSTYLFEDIYKPECIETKFDDKKIAQLIKELNFK